MKVRLAKKGECDDLIVDFRDAYYDLLSQTTQLMKNIDEDKQCLEKEDLLDALNLNIESSLRATKPKHIKV